MRTLLAIKSCHNHRHLEGLQRRMFLSGAQIDYRFFRGEGPSYNEPDVVHLPVADDFYSLPFKLKEVCRWALKENYDQVFFADTDTYVRPERLIVTGGHDYCGYFMYDPEPRAYAVGGSGYWLSQKAMNFVLLYDFILDYPDHDSMEPSKRGEDLQVGWAVQRFGVVCHKDERYRLSLPGPEFHNDFITCHDVAQADKAQRLHDAHNRWVASGGF